MYLGNLTEDQTIDFHFTTRGTDAVPTTLSGTPTLSCFKNNSTTESTAGITLTADFKSTTGLNHVRIDTSADVFYAVANDYSVVVTTGTVDGVSVVGEVVATFSIENRFMEADVVKLNGVAASAANLERSASVIYRGSITDTSTTTALVDSALTQAATDFWVGRVVIFTSGTLAMQATDITAFTPASDTLTVTALTASPSTSDTYVIV